MVKRFCDLCKNEIVKCEWYNLNINYHTGASIHPGSLVITDICEDCYSSIYETIANIKYGNNYDEEELK